MIRLHRLAAALICAGCTAQESGTPLGSAGSGGALSGGATANAGTLNDRGGSAGASESGVAGGPSAESGAGQASSAAGSSGAAGAAGESSGCDAAMIADVPIAFQRGWDPLGYPPYALDGCTLVYLASAGDAGSLHVQQLATGKDELLEPGLRMPRRPTIADGLIAWEADGASGSEVHVWHSGTIETLSGPFDHAGEPRATAGALVFTAFLSKASTGDSDVYLYEVGSGKLSVIADGPGQQRFADVSATHVAVTDFFEDPKGYFDEQGGSISDILLVERTTGLRTPRKLPGKQAFPLLGSDGVFAYLEWGAVHPEPKFSQFWLKGGYVNRAPSEDFQVKASGPVSTNPAYVRPSLRGLSLDFVDTIENRPQLFRADLGMLLEPLPVSISGAIQLFGPVAGDTFTLVATQSARGVSLLAVAR